MKKDVLYDELQQVNQEVQSHDVLFVNEDFNTHVGTVIMGKNGFGNISSNGHRLCDSCEEPFGVCEEPFGHLRKSIAAQRDSQDDLDVPRWQDTPR